MGNNSFVAMRDKLIDNFNKITENANHLFEVDFDKDKLWNLYLDNFPEGTNKIFRERTEHDCCACRHFIKSFGNVVVIENNKVKTIWGFDCGDPTYQPSLNAMDDYIKSCAIKDVFVNKLRVIGTRHNYEESTGRGIVTWSHFYLELPVKFICNNSNTIDTEKGNYRDTKNVFKRSLDEISLEAIETVLDLIDQNALYRGAEWKSVLTQFAEYKREYEATPNSEKDNYTWVKSTSAGVVIGRIRNHSIGTLLTNISNDMNLEEAVRKYEQIVAPSNYKRSNAVFSKKMLEDAKKTIEELGYMDSLPRRFANVDDITINNILFCNKDTANKMGVSQTDIFSLMEKEISVNPKKMSRVEDVSIDTFINEVLPEATELELLLENKHSNNLVSLIAPVNKDSKTMFKWNNNFGWSYNGNVTDSMKENVRKAGGKVDGDLRFSIQWNDTGGYDGNDLDAHCKEPSGFEICFGRAKKPQFSPTQGQLDVDIINPHHNVPAVENITWATRKTMEKGTYHFFVHCYTSRYGKSGFKAEIEFDGKIYSFCYDKPLRNNQVVDVADVILDENNQFSIKGKLPSEISSKTIWNVKTNQFIPVSVVCYSPNYWNENSVGNKHVFFMLKDCINPDNPNGMFNEYLKDELYQKHKKVFEALGNKMAVPNSDDQLSGVGFSMTKRNDVIVKVTTNGTQRTVKVKF